MRKERRPVKDKTKWAKGLTTDQLRQIKRTWPGTIAEMQSGLSAAGFELRRRDRSEREADSTGYSAKRCAERLDRSSGNG